MTAQDREELAELGLISTELDQFEQDAERFCQTAQLYLVRFVARALRRGKSFRQIMSVCGAVWRETWSQGTPGRLGDPDDITTLCPADKPALTWGMQNALAFYRAYELIGLDSPKVLF